MLWGVSVRWRGWVLWGVRWWLSSDLRIPTRVFCLTKKIKCQILLSCLKYALRRSFQVVDFCFFCFFFLDFLYSKKIDSTYKSIYNVSSCNVKWSLKGNDFMMHGDRTWARYDGESSKVWWLDLLAHMYGYMSRVVQFMDAMLRSSTMAYNMSNTCLR